MTASTNDRLAYHILINDPFNLSCGTLEGMEYKDPELERVRLAVVEANANGISDYKLKDITGISQPSIRDFRLGKVEDPRWSIVQRLANAVGLSIVAWDKK